MPSTRSSSSTSARWSRHESTLVLDSSPWAKQSEVGTRISLLFNPGKKNEGWYEGTIYLYDPTFKMYHMRFDDGEPGKYTAKELTEDALCGHLVIMERAP